MTRTLISLPLDLTVWLDRAWPELGGTRSFKVVATDRIPIVDWFWKREQYIGFTLWNTVYVRPQYAPTDLENSEAVELLFHELTHVVQFRSSIFFPLIYLLKSAWHGYKENPYEIEARAKAATMLNQYLRDRPNSALHPPAIPALFQEPGSNS